LDQDELRVFYQPIVRLATGQIAGVEALVRWWRNGAEFMGPGDFIEIAEETGLIVPIGRWVFREACSQAHAWHLLFPDAPPLTTTINISPRQLSQSNLFAEVKSALDETGVAPETLQLEITESMAMGDPKTTARIFSQLKELGVRLSIDDFGTGHSSLSRLRSFPVDVLKIDRSFVRSIEHELDGREIARLIVTLAHHLGLRVIAEGIETPGQRGMLQHFGCDYGQGYLYSRPVDGETLTKLLANDSGILSRSVVEVM
jgi:EAL domain-containing protein (putative c-di-GMP-specific phosphodiesterase class I)